MNGNERTIIYQCMYIICFEDQQDNEDHES